jgi:hypothetical protein
MWTALTRATDLNNVTIFQHSEAEVKELSTFKVKQYLDEKVKGYKAQDKLMDRAYDKNDFIDADWINEEYYKLQVKCCSCCKSPYEMEVDPDAKVKSNLTVDRIDSKKAHTKDNCRLLCKQCNSTKGNRY